MVKKFGKYILTIDSDEEVEREDDIIEDSFGDSKFSFDPNDTIIKERVVEEKPVDVDDYEEELFRVPVLNDDSDEDIAEMPVRPKPKTKPKKSEEVPTVENNSDSEVEDLEKEEFDEKYFTKPKKGSFLKSFKEMNLSRSLLKAIKEMGYDEPTKIQSQAIKPLLNGFGLIYILLKIRRFSIRPNWFRKNRYSDNLN
jgi:hypothetical protein